MATLYECITPKIDKEFRQEIYQKTLEAKQKGTTVKDFKKSIPLVKNAIQDCKMEKEVKEHVLEVISEEIKKVFPEIYIEEVPNNLMDKELRKKLGLPIKKDIVYYPNKREKQTEKVTMIEIVYDFSDGEHILLITTDKGRHVSINSGFLRNMQSPHFVEEMIESDKQGETL